MAPTCSATTWARKSQAFLTCSDTRRGVAWWQETRPQSRPSTRMETDMEAAVPMFFMYSTWTGETLRSTDALRSSSVTAVPPAAAIGWGA